MGIESGRFYFSLITFHFKMAAPADALENVPFAISPKKRLKESSVSGRYEAGYRVACAPFQKKASSACRMDFGSPRSSNTEMMSKRISPS